MFPYREYQADGAMVSSGPDMKLIGSKLAGYVDKILRGAKPADLPVEQMSKYDLVVDLKTAKALGITIPQSILVRADEVIR